MNNNIIAKKNITLRLAFYDFIADTVIGMTLELECTFQANYMKIPPTMIDYMQVAENFLKARFHQKQLISDKYIYGANQTKNTILVDSNPTIDAFVYSILNKELPEIFKFSACEVSNIVVYENKSKLLEMNKN